MNTLRAFEGPLTEQLLRRPGNFGLGQVPNALAPTATTSSVCGYCSTGCSLTIHLRNGKAVNLSPSQDYPVNLGMACPKGWEALTPLASEDRATRPLYRDKRGGELRPIEWSEAATIFCERMRAVMDNHGPESASFLSTGQICTEEMALLGAFAKFGMGMVHGDGNTRQCMATSVVAYKQSFGFDAPPYTYADFEESDVIVLIGANLCIAHPILWQRILRNKRSPKIIVIDPRKTETAMQATQHVPLKPKSDLTLYYGLAHLLMRKGLVNQDFVCQHTNHFTEFEDHVRAFPPEMVAERTGLSTAVLDDLARTIGEQGKRVSFWWTMGVNQGYEATRTAQAIINLALLTGNIGAPGTGANSITGQCNAMGSRLFSNTTNLLGAHDFANPEHREKVATILGLEVERIPEQASKAYDQIIDGIATGDTRALWFVGTNGAHSWANRQRMASLLGRLDFLVVQDMYANTETAKMADLVLPAAGWGEKDGTLINSERRIGLVKKVSPAPGLALSDFRIFRLLARAWGCGDWIDRWESPESVFHLLKNLSKGQPCDISGIPDFQAIDEAGGVQWPAHQWPVESERRLFEDGQFHTSNRRASFVFDAVQANPEPPDDTYPLTFLTGRGTSAQWHTQTRTSKSGILRRLYPEHAYIEIHPADAQALAIESGNLVTVRSRRGEINVIAFVTPTVGEGQVFMPMHYPETNQLTDALVDPHSRQPNYKACTVSIMRS